MSLCLIPARGGSKRIPRKNIREFCGKPMIVWSIAAALKSGCFERIVVSTDDEEIAGIARAAGASVPFVRPASLADDHTGTIAVIQHALGELGQQGYTPDLTCCIYATAPFLRSEDIVGGRDALLGGGYDYAFSVVRYPFPIQRALRLTPDHGLEMFDATQYAARSQDLEEAWHDAGQLYWGKSAAWMDGTAVYRSNTAAIKLPRYRVEDIDTEEDWRRAELLFRMLAVHDQ